MQRDALLTQDELDFIQNMHHNPQLNVRDVTSSLTVNGGATQGTIQAVINVTYTYA